MVVSIVYRHFGRSMKMEGKRAESRGCRSLASLQTSDVRNVGVPILVVTDRGHFLVLKDGLGGLCGKGLQVRVSTS